MTLADIAKMEKTCISPAEAGAAIGCDSNYIRVAARDNPALLPFPVFRSGNRTHIPRLPFLAAMGFAVLAQSEDSKKEQTE